MASDPDFYEFYDTATADTTGNAARGFRVPASTESGALLFTDPAFPIVGQEHPRITGLFCTRIVVAGRHSNNSFEVRAEYALGGTGFGFNPVDQTEPLSKWQSGDYSFRACPVPYIPLRLVNLPGSSAGSIVPTLIGDQIQYIPYAVRQSVYRVTVNVTGYYTDSMDQAISLQLNKIHTFPNTRRYLFTGASFDQQRATSTQIRYEWIYEPDTTLDTLLQPFDDPAKFAIVAPTNGNLILPQYHAFTFDSIITLPTVPPLPTIGTAQAFEDSPNGWTNLPGAPISPAVTA